MTKNQRFNLNLREISPAFAGIVQGVVVHIAKHKFGKNSSKRPSEA